MKKRDCVLTGVKEQRSRDIDETERDRNLLSEDIERTIYFDRDKIFRKYMECMTAGLVRCRIFKLNA